jgi:hypothetical protein
MTDALIAFIESSKEKWEMSGSKVWQGRAGQGDTEGIGTRH